MRARGKARGHVRNDCPACGGTGAVGEGDGVNCLGCEGTGIPVRVGVWRGRWVAKAAVVNGETYTPTASRPARALAVVVRGADGVEREVMAGGPEATNP